MDLASLLSTAAAAGPPVRKGDAAKGAGPKAVVEGMKAGLRAQYVKTGEMSKHDAMAHANQQYASNHEYETKPSPMMEGLKAGLRGWYAKRGQPVVETTMAPMVGDGTERALGQGARWRRPKDRPRDGRGGSLRSQISSLEKQLENTLATLSNRRTFSEEDSMEFRSMLIDALSDIIGSGDTSKLKELKMQSTLIESSRFIGDAIPENDEVLTSGNDPGALFLERMGHNSAGPITEMVATQLSSGMPLQVVRNNVAAAMQSTVDGNVRGTLLKAARVLAEL